MIRPFFLALPLSLMAFNGSPLRAQTNAPRVAKAAAILLDLDALPVLDAPVSLDSPRLPMKDALAQIEKQSGVHLVVPAELEKKNLVAVFETRPVREVMRAFGSLYGLDWETSGAKSFSAQFGASPLERDVLRLGDLDEIAARRFAQSQGAGSLSSKLLAAGLDKAQLSGEGGVPLASLAPALRDAVQEGKQRSAALDVLRPFALKSRFQLSGGQVRVALNPNGAANGQPLAPHFMLWNRDGEPVADLGELQSAPPPETATR